MTRYEWDSQARARSVSVSTNFQSLNCFQLLCCSGQCHLAKPVPAATFFIGLQCVLASFAHGAQKKKAPDVKLSLRIVSQPQSTAPRHPIDKDFKSREVDYIVQYILTVRKSKIGLSETFIFCLLKKLVQFE